MTPFLILKFLVHISFISLIPLVISQPSSIRLDLTHVDSGRGFTKLELLQRMAFRTKARTTAILSKAVKPTNPIAPPVHPGSGGEYYNREYLVRLSIGTPSQPLMLILDTGSDLIWAQCLPCLQCFAQTKLPFYDPSKSSTFAYVSCLSHLCTALGDDAACHQQCIYSYGYGDKSTTVGSVATETFTFESKNKAVVPGIGFGCGNINQGLFESDDSGILGMGRGPLSLISQLGLGRFSYCFTSLFGSKSSPLLLGPPTNFYNNTVKSTPFIQNPPNPTYYYLSLKGITVGKSVLRIPPSAFALNNNTGGVYIDSGTAITSLTDKAYKLVREAFIHQVKLPIADNSLTGLDLCFTVPKSLWGNVKVPKFVFHFENVDLELPRENYIYEDRSSGELCLVMTSSGDTSTTIGNFQQQNIHVLYDLENEKLSFVPVQCDRF